MHIGFYSAKQVSGLTTLSRTSIWRGVQEGWFPKPIQLSAGRKAWPRQDVHEWIEKRSEDTKHAA